MPSQVLQTRSILHRYSRTLANHPFGMVSRVPPTERIAARVWTPSKGMGASVPGKNHSRISLLARGSDNPNVDGMRLKCGAPAPLSRFSFASKWIAAEPNCPAGPESDVDGHDKKPLDMTKAPTLPTSARSHYPTPVCAPFLPELSRVRAGNLVLHPCHFPAQY